MKQFAKDLVRTAWLWLDDAKVDLLMWIVKHMPRRLVFFCALEVLNGAKISSNSGVLEALLKWERENF